MALNLSDQTCWVTGKDIGNPNSLRLYVFQEGNLGYQFQWVILLCCFLKVWNRRYMYQIKYCQNNKWVTFLIKWFVLERKWEKEIMIQDEINMQKEYIAFLLLTHCLLCYVGARFGTFTWVMELYWFQAISFCWRKALFSQEILENVYIW